MTSSSETHRSSSRTRLLDNMDESTRTSTQNDAINKNVSIGIEGVDDTKTKQIKENLEHYEQLFGADEDAFEQPTTTRKELWSYYLYYNVSYKALSHVQTLML